MVGAMAGDDDDGAGAGVDTVDEVFMARVGIQMAWTLIWALL